MTPTGRFLQLTTPYVFLADEPVYMTQLPPICHYRNPPWPGVLIGGRLPINIWPRPMMWAFEWYEPKQDLILRRGEPWFYVRFETEDPSRPLRLIEAEMTPQLKRISNRRKRRGELRQPHVFSIFDGSRTPSKDAASAKAAVDPPFRATCGTRRSVSMPLR